MDDPQDFDIYSLKDTRNNKANGGTGKSYNAKDVARRAKIAEKRAEQANSQKVQEIESEQEWKQKSKYGNGKPKKEKRKQEQFVEINQQLGRPAKKMQKNMRRQ